MPVTQITCTFSGKACHVQSTRIPGQIWRCTKVIDFARSIKREKQRGTKIETDKQTDRQTDRYREREKMGARVGE